MTFNCPEAITLRLEEATTDQLQQALAEAQQHWRQCEAEGIVFTAWQRRADAIREELEKR